jgi:hypothetical protein
VSLALSDGEYATARPLVRADRATRSRSWAPTSRPQPARTPAFVRGEALAMASAMRFHEAVHASISARDLDKALGRLSTRHLEALLTLETTGRSPIAPPLRTEL